MFFEMNNNLNNLTEDIELKFDEEEFLEEGRIVRMSPEAKLRILRARAAMLLAKKNNDPLYDKAQLYRDKLREAKETIKEKYFAESLKWAKQMMENSKNKVEPKRKVGDQGSKIKGVRGISKTV